MLTDAGKIFWSGRQQKDTKSIFVSLEVKEEKEFIRLLRQGNEAALDRYASWV
jgi:plasmid stabilization system protein ParE